MDKAENDIHILEEKYMVDAERISVLTQIPIKTVYTWHLRAEGSPRPRKPLYDLIEYRLASYRNGGPEPEISNPPPGIAEIKEKYCFTNESLSDYTGFSFATVQSWSSGQRECKPYIRYLICFKLQSEKF